MLQKVVCIMLSCNVLTSISLFILSMSTDAIENKNYMIAFTSNYFLAISYCSRNNTSWAKSESHKITNKNKSDMNIENW